MSDQPTTTEGGLAAPTVIAITGDDSNRVQAAVKGLIRKYRNRRHEVALLSADELNGAMAQLMYELADVDPALGIVNWLNWIKHDVGWFTACARDNGLTVTDEGPAVVRDGQLVPLAVERAAIPTLQRAGTMLQETRAEVRLIVKRLIVEFASRFTGVIICVDATAAAVLAELLGSLGCPDKLVKVQLTAANELSNDPDALALDATSLDDLETILALDRLIVNRRPELASRLFILSGPSGVGKATVTRQLKRYLPDLQETRSDTTRKQRDGEPDTAYNFISVDEFERRIAAGYYLEYARFGANYYGTPASAALQPGTMLEIEINGIEQVREKLPNIFVIRIEPPGDTIEHRLVVLRQRIEADTTNRRNNVEDRLAQARVEMQAPADVIITNDDVDRAARAIALVV